MTLLRKVHVPKVRADRAVTGEVTLAGYAVAETRAVGTGFADFGGDLGPS